MKAEVKDNQLIITIPISKRPSASGKSIVIASSNGNHPTDNGLTIDGKILNIGVNAYISK